MRTKIDKQTVKFKVRYFYGGAEREKVIELPRTRDVADLKRRIFLIERGQSFDKLYKKGDFLILVSSDSYYRELFDINGRQYEHIYPSEKLVFVSPRSIEVYENGFYNKTIDMIPCDEQTILSREEFDAIASPDFDGNEIF